MTLEITISVDDGTAKAVAQAFDRQAGQEEACRLFAEIAIRHFCEWLSGSRRFNSLSEQYSAWVEDFYEKILPATEAPNVHRLYNSFNMPHGQATYVARILSEKSLKRWRTQALTDLVADVQIAWDTAKDHLAKNEKNRVVLLRTSKLSGLELQRICDEIWRADKNFIPPTSKTGLGDQRVYEIAAESVKVIRATLGKK